MNYEKKLTTRRRKTIHNAKFVIEVESDKKTKALRTISVFDNRTQEYKTEEFIKERGISWFLDLDDLKQTLNWNLNGDSSKYQFSWGQSSKIKSSGRAYVYH